MDPFHNVTSSFGRPGPTAQVAAEAAPTPATGLATEPPIAEIAEIPAMPRIDVPGGRAFTAQAVEPAPPPSPAAAAAAPTTGSTGARVTSASAAQGANVATQSPSGAALAAAGVVTQVPASTTLSRVGTQTATAATARFADIAEYRRQLRAIRAGGIRLSEHEHVRAYINDYLMMMDPATGVSALDRAAYRRMATVTIPRDMAVIKTRADLALRDRIRAALTSGVLDPGLAAELSPEAAVARTIAAREAAIRARPAGQSLEDLNAITDDVIRRATHYQFGQLFESGHEAARVFVRDAEAFPSDEAFDEAFRERTESEGHSRTSVSEEVR